MKKLNLKKILSSITIDKDNESYYFYLIEDSFNYLYQNKFIKNKKGEIIGINLFSCFDESLNKIFFKILKVDDANAKKLNKEIKNKYLEFEALSDKTGECFSVYMMDYIQDELSDGENIIFIDFDKFAIQKDDFILNDEFECHYLNIASIIISDSGKVKIDAGEYKGYEGEYDDDYELDNYGRPSALIVVFAGFCLDTINIPYGYFQTQSLIRNANKNNFLHHIT